MTPSALAKRSLHRCLLLAALLVSASLPVPAWSGCGMNHDHAAGDGGLQVQVDPKTGAYSMPEPGTLPADPAAGGARERAVTVEPGTTAAGGYTVRLAPSASSETAPAAGAGK